MSGGSGKAVAKPGGGDGGPKHGGAAGGGKAASKGGQKGSPPDSPSSKFASARAALPRGSGENKLAWKARLMKWMKQQKARLAPPPVKKKDDPGAVKGPTAPAAPAAIAGSPDKGGMKGSKDKGKGGKNGGKFKGGKGPAWRPQWPAWQGTGGPGPFHKGDGAKMGMKGCIPPWGKGGWMPRPGR